MYTIVFFTNKLTLSKLQILDDSFYLKKCNGDKKIV